MLAVILAKLTAPSSTVPRWPTVKTLATVREYWRRKVTIRGAEYRDRTLASRCQVVLILPAMTASSHFWLRVSGVACPPYGKVGSPNRGVVSGRSASPSDAAPRAASSSGATTFRSPPGIPAMGKCLLTFLIIVREPSPFCGCFGGIMLLSRNRLLSSFLASCRSVFVGYLSNFIVPGTTVALGPAVEKLGLRYDPIME